MLKRWAGPLVTILILGGVVSILVLNLNTEKPGTSIATPQSADNDANPGVKKPLGFREYPIGDPVETHHMKIVAVWLPPVQMDGQTDVTSGLIHLEADVRATATHPQGLGIGEFVPYLAIHYTITPAGGGPPVQEGDFRPMVASDGLHYGASVAMPKAGSYQLTYDFKPPSINGLGRHVDPATGVPPWWEPFQVRFDWDYQGTTKSQ